ncbi:hypothetical protein GCM10011504_00920 [Siccirubricoccus deserti]|uniref:Uncharacterized protein n=1 Tax=Siccirubricoccus deserti TaxID=2013562 RepID=A0A9X0QUM2_9PROT|nr:hypothetical protein [Siccirubricoccus deserti]MBC4014104.1 hypothetical protein [Siccirubricoccus deserti]GGC26453.1 hypothetical protein GCM10011504_00920 [Siccirubricoccus deserti]
MQTATLTWTTTIGWSPRRIEFGPEFATHFGDDATLGDGLRHAALRALAPETLLFGRSGGHVPADGITDRGADGIEKRDQAMATPLPGGRGA